MDGLRLEQVIQFWGHMAKYVWEFIVTTTWDVGLFKLIQIEPLKQLEQYEGHDIHSFKNK